MRTRAHNVNLIKQTRAKKLEGCGFFECLSVCWVTEPVLAVSATIPWLIKQSRSSTHPQGGGRRWINHTRVLESGWKRPDSLISPSSGSSSALICTVVNREPKIYHSGISQYFNFCQVKQLWKHSFGLGFGATLSSLPGSAWASRLSLVYQQESPFTTKNVCLLNKPYLPPRRVVRMDGCS